MTLPKCRAVLLCQFALVLLLANAAELKLASGEEGRNIRVLSFHPARPENVDFYNRTESWAKLENVKDLELPKNFTICSAVSGDILDGSAFFTLLGENKTEPFLSSRIYDGDTDSCDIDDCVSRLYSVFGGFHVYAVGCANAQNAPPLNC